MRYLPIILLLTLGACDTAMKLGEQEAIATCVQNARTTSAMSDAELKAWCEKAVAEAKAKVSLK